jgi:predicted homoserine dehydrogenase-like protein
MERGVVYSMAYGDQPALVADMVDWAQATGFTVAAAGKGTKYLHRDGGGRGARPEPAGDAGQRRDGGVRCRTTSLAAPRPSG